MQWPAVQQRCAQVHMRTAFFSETPTATEKLMQLHCWPARLYKPNGDTSSRYVHVEIMLRKSQLQRRRICYFSIGKDTREAR